MEIKYLCTIWGMNQPTIEEKLKLIKQAGFDGVEMKAPEGKGERIHLKNLINKTGLDIITQVRAEGRSSLEQIESLNTALLNAVELEPLLVNIHCGKDYWTLEENLQVISAAQNIAKNLELEITHEIHRARATFCTTSTMEIIKSLPEIKFTADFSHWCCVHNSLLHDQKDIVNHVIERSCYIHARVGNAITPQITDPRAPECAKAVDAHIMWWKRIVKHNKNKKTELLPICSEFGPPEYMTTLPFTNEPIADQWEINCYMKDMFKEQIGSTVQ